MSRFAAKVRGTPRPLEKSRPEDLRSRPSQRTDVVEHDDLLAEGSRQAVEQVVQSDRIEDLALAVDRFQYVADQRRRAVARHPSFRMREGPLVEIHEGQTRSRRRKSALVEIVPGPDPDVEMPCRDIAVVVGELQMGRELPDPAIGDSQHDEIVQAQGATGVDGLAGAELFKLLMDDGYGVRDTLLEGAHAYLPEAALRSLVERCQATSESNHDDLRRRHWLIFVEMLARELKDPALFERTRIASWGKLNPAAHLDIARIWFDCGDADTCWSALGESGSPRMQPWAMGLLPFHFGWVAVQMTVFDVRAFSQPPGLRTAGQLTRNWNLGHGFLRRFAYMVWVTRHWSAEQALDGVLDQAWFGIPETFGADASSLALFGQSVDSLDDRQVAILGVLLQRPDLLCNPRQEPLEKWESRIRRHLHPNSERRTELDDAAVIGLMDSLPICQERSRKQPTEESSIEAK